MAKPKEVREKKPRPIVPEITLVRPFDAFPGSTLSRETSDEKAIGKIHYKLLKEEALLFKQKWYDYRRLHPTVATHYFVHCYRAAHSKTVKKAFDIARGPWLGGVKDDWWNLQELSSYWRLRQHADRLGIPYYFFLCEAMDHFLDNTGWTRIPRPAHLGGPEAVAHVAAQWNELCRHRLQLPEDPFYRVAQFVDHPDQIECEAWLVEQALARTNPKFALASLVYNDARVRESALDRLDTRLRGEVESLRDWALSLSHS